MSIRQGNKVIAGVPSRYHPDLFDWKWADHICNDVQWLRADTFSWQSGSVYQAAFNELFYDIQISTYWYGSGGPAYTKSRTPAVGDEVYLNSDLTTQIGTVDSYDDVNDEITVSGDTYLYMSNTYVTPTTETVAGYSLSVYTGHSGRKIVSAGDETNVANIYTATGVAWYYIIDIPNKRFKLPRSKHNKYATTNSVVGNGKTLGFMDGNGREGCLQAYIWNSGYSNGMGLGGASSVGQALPASFSDVRTTFKPLGVSTDATKSGLIAQQTQDTDQYKYLYFYVGEFTQRALENTAGITAETLNDKVDVGHQVIAFQAPTAGNNYTWYRKYADGWVEQGGIATTNGGNATPITLPVEMVDANYIPFIQGRTASDGYNNATWQVMPVNTATSRQTSTQFYAQGSITGYNLGFGWRVEGMAA